MNRNGNGKKANGRQKQLRASRAMATVFSNRRPRNRVRRRNNGLMSVSSALAPTAFGSSVVRPSFRRLERVPIRHCELITSINSSTAYTVVYNAAFNPGLNTQFPWLSTIADNFERYFVRSVQYSYMPAIGTSSAGTLYFSFDYDSADAPPTSKTEMMVSPESTTTTVWKPMMYSLDPNKVQTRGQLYTRSGGLSANLDIKSYDLGRLFVACEGTAADDTFLGDLYVEYDLDLIIPQANSDLTGFFHIGAATSESITAPFGTVVPSGDSPNSPCNLTYDSASGYNYINFTTSGVYLLSFSFEGTAFYTTGSSAAFIDSSPVKTTGEFANDSYTTFSVFGSGQTFFSFCNGVRVTEGQQIPMEWAGAGAALTTITYAELLVTPLNTTVYDDTDF